MAARPKTAAKTAVSPVTGASIPLGAHPGNTGGKKGRSGRKPAEWTAFCNDTARDPKFQAAVKAAALAGDMGAARMIAEYAAGKPTQKLDVTRREAPPTPGRLTDLEREAMLARFLEDARN